MSTLRAYLWREWRQHRLALFAVVGILPVLAALFASMASQKQLTDPFFPEAACVVAILIALLAVGGELLNERRAGGLAWLQRLPAGLTTPFWAKLLFHVPVTAAAGFVGLALAWCAAWMRGAAPADLSHGPLLLVVAAAVALWTFAASAWCGRSVLALFGAGFVLFGFGLPVVYLASHGYLFPDRLELEGVLALPLLAWLPSAWAGFGIAGRFGRGPGLAGGLGLSLAAAAMLPLWLHAAWQLHERDRFDPTRPGFEILRAVATEDGRSAFLETWADDGRWRSEVQPKSVVRVDVESGASSAVAGGIVDGRYVVLGTLTDETGRDVIMVSDRARGLRIEFARSTGERVEQRGPAKYRASASYRPRSWQQRCWPFEAEDGLVDVESGAIVRPATLGLARGAHLGGNGRCWLVLDGEDRASRLDPTSGVLHRAPGLDGIADFGPCLPDGRFFALLRSGELVLVDPDCEEMRRFSERRHDYLCDYLGQDFFEPGEPNLLWTPDGMYLFEPEAEQLHWIPGPYRQLAGTAPDGSLLLCSEQTLWRYDVERETVTRLFPRAR